MASESFGGETFDLTSFTVDETKFKLHKQKPLKVRSKSLDHYLSLGSRLSDISLCILQAKTPVVLRDAKYWEHRKRNTENTRKSRTRSRILKNQIKIRLAFLEKENLVLKKALDAVNEECQALQERKAQLQKQQ